jgi:predicted nucleic acid-binding protein
MLARFDALVTPAQAAPDCRLPCRDPDDRKFLDLAVSRRVDWLLSRDKALLASRKTAWGRFGVRIGKVGDFYNWLDQSRAETPTS